MRPLYATLFLSLLGRSTAKFQNDFSAYPKGAETCLEKASDASGCDGDTVLTMNKCLCSDGGDFLTSSAKCIGKESKDDLKKTYDTLVVNCSGSKTPMKMTKDEFVKLGSVTPSSSQTSTASSTSPTVTITETTSPPPATGGLSREAQAVIGAVAGVIALALIAAVIFMLMRRRRRKLEREESHPMLGAAPALGYDSSPQPTPGLDAFQQDQQQGWKSENKQPGSPKWRPISSTPGLAPPGQTQLPAWDNRHTSWNSEQSSHQSWGPPQQGWAVPSPPQQVQHHGPQVFELSETTSPHSQGKPRPGAIEMPGDQPAANVYSGADWGR